MNMGRSPATGSALSLLSFQYKIIRLTIIEYAANSFLCLFIIHLGYQVECTQCTVADLVNLEKRCIFFPPIDQSV